MPGIQSQSKAYINIVGGTFRKSATEGEEGASERHYELKDGTKKSKWEHTFKAWEGRILDIEFRDGKFGMVVDVLFDDAIIQISKNTRYFSDFLKKLPNVDFSKDVQLNPYDFEGDDGKTVTGISIKQGGEKVQSLFYYDKEKKEAVGGLPQPEEDTKSWSSEDWKVYFHTVDKFLIKYIEDNVFPKLVVGDEVSVVDIDI